MCNREGPESSCRDRLCPLQAYYGALWQGAHSLPAAAGCQRPGSLRGPQSLHPTRSQVCFRMPCALTALMFARRTGNESPNTPLPSHALQPACCCWLPVPWKPLWTAACTSHPLSGALNLLASCALMKASSASESAACSPAVGRLQRPASTLHNSVHAALLLSSASVRVRSADWMVDTSAAEALCERGCATMCRPGCSGWHPEYGKAWEHWGMPRYTM